MNLHRPRFQSARGLMRHRQGVAHCRHRNVCRPNIYSDRRRGKNSASPLPTFLGCGSFEAAVFSFEKGFRGTPNSVECLKRSNCGPPPLWKAFLRNCFKGVIQDSLRPTDRASGVEQTNGEDGTLCWATRRFSYERISLSSK